MTKSIALFLVFLLLGTFIWAQVTSDFSLLVNPTLNIPLGPVEGDTPFYSIGGGLSIKGEYNFPFFRYMYGGVALDVDFVPICNAGKALIVLAGGQEIGFRFAPFPRFNVKAVGYGGMYFGTASGGSVFNPFVAGGADLSFLLSPSLNIGVGATYKYHFLPGQYLYEPGLGLVKPAHLRDLFQVHGAQLNPAEGGADLLHCLLYQGRLLLRVQLGVHHNYRVVLQVL